jgi:hypothetical protein
VSCHSIEQRPAISSITGSISSIRRGVNVRLNRCRMRGWRGALVNIMELKKTARVRLSSQDGGETTRVSSMTMKS